MNTKLTLSIDKSVIRNVKIFAKKKKVSVSSLIENYMQSIARDESSGSNNSDIMPVVRSRSGVISLPVGFAYKTIY